MTAKSPEPGRFSLRRWSQRKLEVARAESRPTESQPTTEMSEREMDASADADLASTPLVRALATPGPALPTSAELPPIESLTIESDFAPFFKPQVPEVVKRAALKQLFRDPRFNVMDGLDVYIDDYTQPDPIPAAMIEDLMERRGFFAPSAETAAVERDANGPAADEVSPPATVVADAKAAVPVSVSPAQTAPSEATPPAVAVGDASPPSTETSPTSPEAAAATPAGNHARKP